MLIQASQGPASPASFCKPCSSFSSYFSPTFQSQPLPPPHHLKFSSKLADTHGRVFPTIPFSLPFQVSDGGGDEEGPPMHCLHEEWRQHTY